MILKIDYKLKQTPKFALSEPYDFKIFTYENEVSNSCYNIKLIYEGEYNYELFEFADEIAKIDILQPISVILNSDIHLDFETASIFFKTLEGMHIYELTINPTRITLTKEQTRALIDYLSNPKNNKIRFLSVGIEDVSDVLPILKAFKNNYWLEECEIKTQKPVDKETEDYAVSLIDTHIATVIQINSRLKLIRPMARRGIYRS